MDSYLRRLFLSWLDADLMAVRSSWLEFYVFPFGPDTWEAARVVWPHLHTTPSDFDSLSVAAYRVALSLSSGFMVVKEPANG